MNRRMIRAKAARKFHAARARIFERQVARVRKALVDGMAKAISGNARFADAMREAAQSMQRMAQELAAQKLVRKVLADIANPQRFHTGGYASRDLVGARFGEVATVLSPGRVMMRPRGSDEPMREVGTTGPITVTQLVRRPMPRCATCGHGIQTCILMGTRCGCVDRPG